MGPRTGEAWTKKRGIVHSMSTWSQSAPWSIVRAHSSPNRAKSAERIEGAMMAGGVILSELVLVSSFPFSFGLFPPWDFCRSSRAVFLCRFLSYEYMCVCVCVYVYNIYDIPPGVDALRTSAPWERKTSEKNNQVVMENIGSRGKELRSASHYSAKWTRSRGAFPRSWDFVLFDLFRSVEEWSWATSSLRKKGRKKEDSKSWAPHQVSALLLIFAVFC